MYGELRAIFARNPENTELACRDKQEPNMKKKKNAKGHEWIQK